MKKLLLFCFVCLIIWPIDSKWIVINPIVQEKIIVEIRGFVENPGFYELSRGATLNDLLQVAGIFDESKIESLNMTQVLHHQDVITITQKSENIIFLNSATKEELMTLPGIGETMADRIIEYRTEHLFQTIEEIMQVNGIGKKKFEKIKGLIGL